MATTVLEMMRKRHAYFTKMIEDNGIKSAREFYERFREHFMLYCASLEMLSNERCCITLRGSGDYLEDYLIIEKEDGDGVYVDSLVGFQCDDPYVEIDIFEE